MLFVINRPEAITNAWPSPETKLFIDWKRNLAFKHQNALNMGAGPLINASTGLYASDYFQLYHLLMSRLRIHPKRTLQRSEATLFVIPYDVGIFNQV